MNKLVKTVLLGILVGASLCMVGCGEKYTNVQQQVINQFEDGIENIKKSKEYAKKEDHEAKASYAHMGMECLMSVYEITKDGDMYVTDTRDPKYIYYYEHKASDNLFDIYSSYDFVLNASREFNEEEWDEFIDKLEEEVDVYKQNCEQLNKVNK